LPTLTDPAVSQPSRWQSEAIGSNILNMTLILAVAALVARVVVTSSVIRREVRPSVAAVVLFALAAWWGLSVWSGAILVIAMGLLVRWAQQGRNTDLAGDATEFAGTAAAAVALVRGIRQRTTSWLGDFWWTRSLSRPHRCAGRQAWSWSC
jgi:hypothetical protein